MILRAQLPLFRTLDVIGFASWKLVKWKFLHLDVMPHHLDCVVV